MDLMFSFSVILKNCECRFLSLLSHHEKRLRGSHVRSLHGMIAMRPREGRGGCPLGGRFACQLFPHFAVLRAPFSTRHFKTPSLCSVATAGLVLPEEPWLRVAHWPGGLHCVRARI